MSIEIALFALRVLAGLSLAGFLLTLYLLIWRRHRRLGRQLQSARTVHGYLIGIAEIEGQWAQLGTRFALLPLTTLGRSATNSIPINDDFVSSKHARISLQNGQWWLEDRSSRNGTLLNREPVRHPTILANGDVIGIGKFSYRLELIQ